MKWPEGWAGKTSAILEESVHSKGNTNILFKK